jgi:hypothetical protein
MSVVSMKASEKTYDFSVRALDKSITLYKEIRFWVRFTAENLTILLPPADDSGLRWPWEPDWVISFKAARAFKVERRQFVYNFDNARSHRKFLLNKVGSWSGCGAIFTYSAVCWKGVCHVSVGLIKRKGIFTGRARKKLLARILRWKYYRIYSWRKLHRQRRRTRY